MLRRYHIKGQLEAGCDEAGRGCLAGPVFAAAVVLPQTFRSQLLDDSKKINEETRDQLRVQIESEAISWAVAYCDHKEIDKLNILWASVRAMHKALNKLESKPDLILVDGNKFRNYKDVNHLCVVKGDGIYNSIAAASVLAKTHRDEYMKKAHKKYPEYGWNKNKAYPTLEHKNAIQRIGISPIHRLSFKCKGVELKQY
ncbi:MAG: ribonuclease HII [Bacteroidia bacterium]|nr:ribonuclease HII [Bacteroidia bacterium]